MNTFDAAVNVLRRHNRWRRGDDTVEAVDPALLGCAIDTVCDHIEKQAKVPDDVVTVPIAPTEEMVIAALREVDPLRELIDWQDGHGFMRDDVRRAWSAMLAAKAKGGVA